MTFETPATELDTLAYLQLQIDDLQAYLRDLNAQVSALHAQGVSAQDATARVDLSDHAEHYGPRVASVDPRAVLRMYELLQVKMPR